MMPRETTFAMAQAANALLLFVECYDALLLFVEQHRRALDLHGMPPGFLCVACECSDRALAANGRTARADFGMRRRKTHLQGASLQSSSTHSFVSFSSNATACISLRSNVQGKRLAQDECTPLARLCN